MMQTEIGVEGQRIEIQPPATHWTALLGDRRVLAILLAAVLMAVGGYLFSSHQLLTLGFPLDDAWIHQTYARNLALLGEWSFIPGRPSAGSTAPLWSVLLAAGYLLRLQPYIWTYLLGGLSLLGLAVCGEALLRSCRPHSAAHIPWAGLFLVGEWHLVWAAGSGMETLLSAMLILLVLWRLGQARGRGWFGVGLLIGLAVWVRPDSLTLLGPAGFTLFLLSPGWRGRIEGLGWLIAGFALFFGPYLLFNLLVQGSPWPNTFYAKQAEYASHLQLPLLQRFLDEVKLPLIGGGLFLLPGFVFFTWQAVQKKNIVVLAAVLWFLGYALLYALRLPVTYQYGRYFMPAMPVFFVLGLAGLIQMGAWFLGSPLKRVIYRVWVLSMVGIWLGFYGIGAGQYARDVAIIDTEMVAAARWVAGNTDPQARIAAHDIGALGYFANRDLVDLAGLVSPEVIPFIRDEGQIARWLDGQQIDYLVVFEDWYEQLPEGKTNVYRTDGWFSRQLGGSNIWIYSW